MSFDKHIKQLKEKREDLTSEYQMEDEEAVLFNKLINEQQVENPEHYSEFRL